MLKDYFDELVPCWYLDSHCYAILPEDYERMSWRIGQVKQFLKTEFLCFKNYTYAMAHKRAGNALLNFQEFYYIFEDKELKSDVIFLIKFYLTAPDDFIFDCFEDDESSYDGNRHMVDLFYDYKKGLIEL